jgi:diaminopimelate decarboxylase
VPGIIKIIKDAGLKAEVMSEPELLLALKLGYTGKDIVVNGPYKTDELIITCLRNNVRLINIDSIFELEKINFLCNSLGKETDVLLRINPDFIPAGMNKGSATGGRIGSPFGLDLKGGEVNKALDMIQKMDRIRFKGFHFHIGSGIQHADDYRKVMNKLKSAVNYAGKSGFTVDVLDIGGGLGVPHSREMTTREMLFYQAFDALPSRMPANREVSFSKYAVAITSGMNDLNPADVLQVPTSCCC